MKQKTFTISEIKSGDASGVTPEFGRWQDVRRIYGIKRGVLYRKMADGTIRSISLREPGKKTGCRLIHMQSVRDWLQSLLESQTTQKPNETN